MVKASLASQQRIVSSLLQGLDVHSIQMLVGAVGAGKSHIITDFLKRIPTQKIATYQVDKFTDLPTLIDALQTQLSPLNQNVKTLPELLQLPMTQGAIIVLEDIDLMAEPVLKALQQAFSNSSSTKLIVTAKSEQLTLPLNTQQIHCIAPLSKDEARTLLQTLAQSNQFTLSKQGSARLLAELTTIDMLIKDFYEQLDNERGYGTNTNRNFMIFVFICLMLIGLSLFKLINAKDSGLQIGAEAVQMDNRLAFRQEK